MIFRTTFQLRMTIGHVYDTGLTSLDLAPNGIHSPILAKPKSRAGTQVSSPSAH